MKLAVIIPAYQRVADVLTCINSLRALRACDDTVFHVQDDTSPDANFPALIPPEVATVARNERNLGFAGNVNAGARAAIALHQPDVLLICNQDVYAVPEWSQGWDAALLDAFRFDDANERIGIVGARLLFPDSSVQNAGGTFDQFAQPVHRCLGWSNPRVGAPSEAADVAWTTGAALAVQTTLFQHLNGFDERYARGYFEDVDLCMRAQQAGARIRYTPDCTLIHSVGSTGGSPYFPANARRFKQQWVDTGIVKPGTLTPQMRYW